MPPEQRDPTDPLDWLRRARSKLARARATVETRHPGVENVTEEEYHEALELAELVVRWAEKTIEVSARTE